MSSVAHSHPKGLFNRNHVRQSHRGKSQDRVLITVREFSMESHPVSPRVGRSRVHIDSVSQSAIGGPLIDLPILASLHSAQPSIYNPSVSLKSAFLFNFPIAIHRPNTQRSKNVRVRPGQAEIVVKKSHFVTGRLAMIWQAKPPFYTSNQVLTPPITGDPVLSSLPPAFPPFVYRNLKIPVIHFPHLFSSHPTLSGKSDVRVRRPSADDRHVP